MKTITTLTDTTAMAAVRHEIGLENEYRQIGLAFNLNELMLADGKYQQFTIKYSKFSKKGLETPPSFSELGSHIHDFVEINDFTDDKATNAGIWVISRVWKKKHESGVIFDTEIKDKYQEIYQAKKEQTELHKAVHKLAKRKAGDSFEAGLAVNFKELMTSTGCQQLKQLVTETEQAAQLESIKRLA